MEISKIQFESMKSLGITQSFDDLDVNKDGVISDKDKDSATGDIAKVISNLITSANKDVENLTDLNDDKAIDEIDKILKNYAEVVKAGESDATPEDVKAKLAELKDKLGKVNTRIAEINKEISELEAENKKLEEQQAQLLKDQEAAQAEVDKAAEHLETEQARLETYTKEYDAYQEEIETLNKQILREQEREEEDFQSEMDVAVKDAINNYNPEKDGEDFDAYFAKKMDSIGFPTFTRLNSLNWDAEALSDAAEGVLKNIMTQSGIVNSANRAVIAANDKLADVNAKLKDVNDAITANNTKITTLKSELETKMKEKEDIQKQIDALVPPVPGGGLSAAEVLAKIPEAEKKLCIEKGIDLTKCVVAMGADGIFHVYQEGGKSVVRQYAEGGGFDTSKQPSIASGSGYINGITEIPDENRSENSNGRAVYYFNSVNCDWTDGCADERACCYSTCSPLSFDVDGNGVNTTAETVSFDIDGDGQLDTVNNSAEWVLAFDKDHDGIAGEDGSELFGNNTDLDGDGKADGYKDGFEALKALAKKEGLIGEGDTVLDEKDIELLSKKYGLTMTNGYGGEAKSLVDLGITEINLAETSDTTLEKNFDGRHNDIMTQEGATFKVNGETREYADIWNAKKDPSEAVRNDKPLTEVKWGSFQYAKTNKEDVSLNINKNGVLALHGNVDFKFIKDKSQHNVDAPKNIFEEVVEIKEEDEEEI